jgi:hypothetical protein
MPRSDRYLTDEQAEHFLERGFVVVRNAFDVAGPRERVVPDRVRRQQARAAEENMRLADAERDG